MPKFSSYCNRMKMISKNFKKMVMFLFILAYDERPPEKIKAKQWREDWEDEDINDDFAERLRR